MVGCSLCDRGSCLHCLVKLFGRIDPPLVLERLAIIFEGNRGYATFFERWVCTTVKQEIKVEKAQCLNQKITAGCQFHGGTLVNAQRIGKLGFGGGKTELERPHALRLRRSGPGWLRAEAARIRQKNH
jgi:hypothetical protein